MITPYPGPTTMFLEELTTMQNDGYAVYLSIENPESKALLQRKFGELSPVDTDQNLPAPDILFLSGLETEEFSVAVIDRFRDMQPSGTVVFQEDTPGSMRRLVDFSYSHPSYAPDILLTPTVWKAKEYNALSWERPVSIAAVGNPDLDMLPGEHAPDTEMIRSMREALGIDPHAMVFYLVGKAAQDMELTDDIKLPEHQDVTGILSGRRDMNSFFLHFSMKAIEAFRLSHASQIGDREIVVLYRPHPRDRDNIAQTTHLFGRWFNESYPDSSIRIVNMTTKRWNELIAPEALFYISDMSLFFDSTLINRVVMELASQYKKYGRGFEQQHPHVSFPVIFHPWAALCIPWFHRRVQSERIFVSAFTRHWEELASSIIPAVMFQRKDIESEHLDRMFELARQHRKIDETDVWNDGSSAQLVLQAVHEHTKAT